MTNTETLKALFAFMFNVGYRADSDVCVRTADGAEEWYSATSEYGDWYGKDTNCEEFFSRVAINSPAKFQVLWYLPEHTDLQEQRLEIVVPVFCVEAHNVTATSWSACEKQINMLTNTFWHDCGGEVITKWFEENNTFALTCFVETASRARPREYGDLNYMAARLNAMVGILLGSIADHEDIVSYPQCFNETLRVSRQLGKLQSAVMPRVKGLLVGKHALDYGWRD